MAPDACRARTAACEAPIFAAAGKSGVSRGGGWQNGKTSSAAYRVRQGRGLANPRAWLDAHLRAWKRTRGGGAGGAAARGVHALLGGRCAARAPTQSKTINQAQEMRHSARRGLHPTYKRRRAAVGGVTHGRRGSDALISNALLRRRRRERIRRKRRAYARQRASRGRR